MRRVSKSEVTFRRPLSQPTQRPDIGLARIRTPGTPGHLTRRPSRLFVSKNFSSTDSSYSTRLIFELIVIFILIIRVNLPHQLYCDNKCDWCMEKPINLGGSWPRHLCTASYLFPSSSPAPTLTFLHCAFSTTTLFELPPLLVRPSCHNFLFYSQLLCLKTSVRE